MAKGLWPVLNVANIDKTTEFYKALGLRAKSEEMPGVGTFASIELAPNTGIVFWPKDNIAPGQAADTRAWLSGELGKGVLFSIGVANATKTWEKVKALRFDVDQPLRAQEWGGNEFTVVDPDGYVINVTDRFPGPTLTPKKAKPKTAKPKTAKKKTTKRR